MAMGDGSAELDAFLASLPEKLARNVARGGLRAAAVVVAEEAKHMARNEQVSAAIGVSTGRRGDLVYSKVRLKGPGAYKGIWLEYGTLPHLISVQAGERTTPAGRVIGIGTINRNLRALAKAADKPFSLVIAGRFVGPTVQHPGARPYPFMRPALDARQEAAVAAMATYVRDRLESNGLEMPDVGGDDDEDEGP